MNYDNHNTNPGGYFPGEYKNKLNQVFNEVELTHNFFQSFNAGEQRLKATLESDTICAVALYKEPAIKEDGNFSERLWKLIQTNKEN
jgi:hypothetical protein